MQILGHYLKQLRESQALALKDIYRATGITDSKLLRIENDKIKEPSPTALKKLADFYDVDVLKLYIMAGYLDEASIDTYVKIFHGVEYLTEEEKQLIQQQINLLIKCRISREEEKL